MSIFIYVQAGTKKIVKKKGGVGNSEWSNAVHSKGGFIVRLLALRIVTNSIRRGVIRHTDVIAIPTTEESSTLPRHHTKRGNKQTKRTTTKEQQQKPPHPLSVSHAATFHYATSTAGFAYPFESNDCLASCLFFSSTGFSKPRSTNKTETPWADTLSLNFYLVKPSQYALLCKW